MEHPEYKREKTFLITAAVMAVLLLAGCLGGTAVTPGTTRYVLEYPKQSAVLADTAPACSETLTVIRFTAVEACRGTSMLYRVGPFERKAYPYHRWKNSPADMVTDYLANDLARDRTFKAVFTDYSFEKSRFYLEGRVIDCLEIVEDGRREALFGFTATLLDAEKAAAAERVLFQNTYRNSAAIDGDGPAGLAAAMSGILEQLSKRLIADMGAAVTPDGSR